MRPKHGWTGLNRGVGSEWTCEAVNRLMVEVVCNCSSDELCIDLALDFDMCLQCIAKTLARLTRRWDINGMQLA